MFWCGTTMYILKCTWKKDIHINVRTYVQESWWMCACTCTHILSLSSQNCPLPHDILDRFTEKFYSSCQTHFVQNVKHLVQSFEESFSSQQVCTYVYMYVRTYYVRILRIYIHVCVDGWMDLWCSVHTKWHNMHSLLEWKATCWAYLAKWLAELTYVRMCISMSWLYVSYSYSLGRLVWWRSWKVLNGLWTQRNTDIFPAWNNPLRIKPVMFWLVRQVSIVYCFLAIVDCLLREICTYEYTHAYVHFSSCTYLRTHT